MSLSLSGSLSIGGEIIQLLSIKSLCLHFFKRVYQGASPWDGTDAGEMVNTFLTFIQNKFSSWGKEERGEQKQTCAGVAKTSGK